MTDQEILLMAAIYKIFPHITNLLCLWHINKCVQGKWKQVFQNVKNSEEEWEKFHEKWRNVVYAKTEEAYTPA